MPTYTFRGCEFNAQEELRTTAHIRLYVDAAVVQLQIALGHRQADTAAAALRREVEIEDSLADFGRNAVAFIGDAEDRHPAFLFQNHPECAAIRHCLCAVERHIEYGLFEQIGVDIHDHRARGQPAFQLHALRCQFVDCEGENVRYDGAQILLTKLQLNWT